MKDHILAALQLDKPFILTKTHIWTYQDCKRNVIKLNKFLERNQYSKILICLDQEFYAYCCIIGVYISEATFCCINPIDPIDRKLFLIESFQPDVIICNDDDMLANYDICIQKISPERLFECDEDILDREYDFVSLGSNIAYVLFTSGTTGRPKGAKIFRESLNTLILWAGKEFSIAEKDICAQFSNLNFDMSIFDIFLCITNGASLVPFPSLSDKLFPGKLIKLFKVTFWNSVPTVIDILEKANQLNYATLHSLKTMKFGGDRVFPTQLEKLFNILANLRIIITYGPTETTIFCTYSDLYKSNYLDFAETNMALGKPIPGTLINLTNKDDEGIGEIVICGDCVGDGYISSEHNQQNFITITIDDHSERAYLTGDYGKYKGDVLYFYGRKDSQIKIKGNRVDLSEVDYHARQLGCNSTVTIYYRDLIVLFYESSKYNNQEVKEYLKSKLSVHLMPALVLQLDGIPKMTNGKYNHVELMKKIDELLERK